MKFNGFTKENSNFFSRFPVVRAYATRSISSGEEVTDCYSATFATAPLEERQAVHARYGVQYCMIEGGGKGLHAWEEGRWLFSAFSHAKVSSPSSSASQLAYWNVHQICLLPKGQNCIDYFRPCMQFHTKAPVTHLHSTSS